MTVYLVGAGPGDPDLLTIRAFRLLAQADVVIHDRLVGPEILAWIRPGAEIIPVGKDPYGRSVPQEETNRLLIEHGRLHGAVVRLKGGDPFVFGRGGEEALDLQAAGIDYEIVPGVTSAVAAPAVAGVPVTHRGVSSAFTVVTGRRAAGTGDVDWNALARTGTTLVILMGARRSADIARRLIDGGLAPGTPVAVVTSATNCDQRIRHLRLHELGRDPVANPSVIVVGDVTALGLTPINSLGSDLPEDLAEDLARQLGSADPQGAFS